MENQTSSPHLALLCSPGMGHLIPVIQFASRLAQVHNFTITLMISTENPSSPTYLSLLESLPDKVNTITLPSPPPDSFPKDVTPFRRIALTVASTLPQVHETLTSLLSNGHLDALVVDLFSYAARESASKLGLPCYLFYSSTCMLLALGFHAPELVESYQGEFKDLPEPVQLPGCVPINGRDLVEPLQNRNSEMFQRYIDPHCKSLLDMDGILVNTFEELEPGAVKAFKEADPCRPKVYAVGPLIRQIESEPDQSHASLTWLDSQREKSVVYVSFGSWGLLTPEQITELALGLELSNNKFLWVFKEGVNLLPEGFIERNKENGHVVTLWAPQLAILKHKSIGSFITHCGWGSALESIVSGIPMIAYPLYAEQRMNTVLLTDDAKICLRLKECKESGLIMRDEIARVVKCSIEGEEMVEVRQRVAEMKEAAMGALLEGGSSYRALNEVVRVWKKDAVW